MPVIRYISKNIQATRRTTCTELALKKDREEDLSNTLAAWKKWLQQKQNKQKTTPLSTKECNGKSGYITTDGDEHT